MEDYRTIRGTAIGEYEEKKSRFIAQLSFADSEEAAVAFLEKVRALAGCCWARAAWYGLTPRLRPGHWKMRRSSRCAASLN